jgi:hypothetical protein
MREGSNIGFIEFHERASSQAMRQNHGAIAYADQSTDGMTDSLHHAANFSVTTLGDGDTVPTVGALTATIFNGAKLGHAIF